MDGIFYNNKVLNEQERMKLCEVADDAVRNFAESIDGMHEWAEKVASNENKGFRTIEREFIDISIFVAYCYCDISLMTKQFMQCSNLYERAFIRGKLKVAINEAFKKLYGFTKNAQCNSYFTRLKKLAALFPRFSSEIQVFEKELHEYSIKDSWWKDERDAEVHWDIEKLYQYRHEEVNESKVMMEAHFMIDILLRVESYTTVLHKTFIASLTIKE